MGICVLRTTFNNSPQDAFTEVWLSFQSLPPVFLIPPVGNGLLSFDLFFHLKKNVTKNLFVYSPFLQQGSLLYTLVCTLIFPLLIHPGEHTVAGFQDLPYSPLQPHSSSYVKVTQFIDGESFFLLYFAILSNTAMNRYHLLILPVYLWDTFLAFYCLLFITGSTRNFARPCQIALCIG